MASPRQQGGIARRAAGALALLLPGLGLAALPPRHPYQGEPGASATGGISLRSLPLPARLKATVSDEPLAAPVYIPPRGYVCYRAPKPPVIDGKLDDEAWKAAPWSEWFVDIEGDKKPAPA